MVKITTGCYSALNVVPQYSGYEELCISWPEDDYFDFLPTQVGYCTSLPGVQVFPELFNVMLFFVALITNTIMYARIIIALHSRLSERSVGTRSTQSCTIRNQVARLLIVNGTLFFLLQGPYRLKSVHSIMVHLTGEGILTTDQYNSLVFYGRSLMLINSLINPFVYVFMSSHYRRGFIEAYSL